MSKCFHLKEAGFEEQDSKTEHFTNVSKLVISWCTCMEEKQKN